MRHLATAFALLGLACGGEPTEPEPPLSTILADATLEIVAGDLQADTILARLPTALEVQLTDDAGLPIAGAPIRYVAAPDCGEAFLGHGETDATGHTADVWDLGTVAGECTMEVRALDQDDTPRIVTTFTATVEAGTPAMSAYWVDQEGPNPSALGDSLVVDHARGEITDQAGNPIPYTITVTGGPFTAREAERAWVIRAGTLGTGTADVSTGAGLWLAITLDSCEDAQGAVYVRWVSANYSLPTNCPS